MLKPLLKILPAMFTIAGLLLTGCDNTQSTAQNTSSKAASAQVSIAAIAAETEGFAVGPAMSVRTIYVFFDAQCPHCAALWKNAEPLRSQAKFVWIPVGLINASSTAQGATLLAAQDPVSAMDEHEASLQARRGGISAGGNLDTKKAAVGKNTELFNRFGFASVPTIVGIHAQTGALVTQEGALPTASLAAFLGLRVPTK
ncbi:MAG: thioredoxin fold domain-containing protein [Polaromonas sp.]|nr:thioredoxin fold domain-containing protein [Polaromonas sp.]